MRSSHTCENSPILKRSETTSAGEGVEKKGPPTLLVRMHIYSTLMESSMELSQNIKHGSAVEPGNSTF